MSTIVDDHAGVLIAAMKQAWLTGQVCTVAMTVQRYELLLAGLGLLSLIQWPTQVPGKPNTTPLMLLQNLPTWKAGAGVNLLLRRNGCACPSFSAC